MSAFRATNVSLADEAAQIDALREAMIAELGELKAIRSDRVADAFRTVPRHLFAPGEPLENAYAVNSTMVTKRDEHGGAVSAVSAAHIQATMLEQAQLGPGMRVLEIGSGGYNAALIAELGRSANPRSANRGVPTAVSKGSFAYRTKRPIEGTSDFETGVYAHGPQAETLAEQYVELIRTWDRDHRSGPETRIEVYSAATPDADLSQGRVIDKKHTRVVISWPGQRTP